MPLDASFHEDLTRFIPAPCRSGCPTFARDHRNASTSRQPLQSADLVSAALHRRRRSRARSQDYRALRPGTFMFADVSGFTALSERLAQENSTRRRGNPDHHHERLFRRNAGNSGEVGRAAAEICGRCAAGLFPVLRRRPDRLAQSDPLRLANAARDQALPADHRSAAGGAAGRRSQLSTHHVGRHRARQAVRGAGRQQRAARPSDSGRSARPGDGGRSRRACATR